MKNSMLAAAMLGAMAMPGNNVTLPVAPDPSFGHWVNERRVRQPTAKRKGHKEHVAKRKAKKAMRKRSRK